MLKNRKLLSLFISFLFIITTFVIPMAGQLVAYASPAYSIDRGSVLTINHKVGINYDHDISEKLKFDDFSVDTDVEVIIYNPQGSVVRNWTSVSEAYTFENIGLHALQFRVLDADDNIFTYSLNYYVNVFQKDYKFVLDGTIVNGAKLGTSITVPDATYISNDTTEVAGVRVFNPYGSEVAINDNTFTTSDLLVGNYYVEYYYENGNVSHYKTFTIAVTKDFAPPSNLTISIPNAEGQLDAKNTIDVFKFYSLKNVKLIAQNGSVINSEIVVSVFNQSTNKYYTISEGKWVESDSETTYDINSDTLIDFVCNDISSFREKGFGKDGDTLVFKFSAISCYGQTETKSLSKTLVFNDKMFSIAVLGFVPSRINADIDTTLTSAVSEETQEIIIAGFDIIIAETYDKDAIFDVINFQKKATASSNGVIVVEGDNFKLTYPEKVRASYSFSLVYNIEYNDNSIDPEETSYTLQMLTKSVTVNKLELDEIKPNNIKIGDYSSIHRFEINDKFLLPAATANFYYETNASSYEALSFNNFTVYIDDLLIEGLRPGDEIDTFTEAKVYKITYRAQGYYGDYREYSFYVNSLSEAVTSSDFTLIDLIKTDNNYLIENSNIDQVVVYDNEGNYVPVNNIYIGGYLSQFDVDFDADKTYYITLISIIEGKSSYLTFAYYVNEKLSQVQTQPLSYNINGKFYQREKTLEKYATTEIVIGQGVLIFNDATSGNFSFEAANPNYYVNNGAIYFYKAGNYTLNVGSVKYYVKVVDEVEAKIEYLKQISPVAGVGSNVELVDPVLTNCFGYKLEKNITKSNGHDYSNDNSFEIASVDNYKITYRFITSEGKVFTDNKIIFAGNTTKPAIIIEDSYNDVVFNGNKLMVDVIDSYGSDKNGTKITNIIVEVYDPFGKKIDIINGKFEVDKTGIYTIYYTLTDSDGVSNTEKVTFVSAYPNAPEKSDKLPVWAIVLICVGSVLAAALIVIFVLWFVKKIKAKTRFVSKSKVQKKQQKSSQKNIIFSIAPSKDNKQWFVKRNNRMFAKCKTRDEAMQKAKENKQSGDEIKVYNKVGRLIDTIK